MRPVSDWGQSKNRKASGGCSPWRGRSGYALLAWSLWLCHWLSHYDQSVNSPRVHPLPERIKNVECALISSKGSRKRNSLVSFPRIHYTMWNITPLHHMPQQISRETVPMTVVVNSMKASHKTAEFPWYDRNMLAAVQAVGADSVSFLASA